MCNPIKKNKGNIRVAYHATPTNNGTGFDLSFWCNKTKQKHTNKIMSNVVGGSISMRPTGITLIALVITIIVLLILAGVVLHMVIGENGIFRKANNSKEDTNYNTALEEINIIILQAQTEAASENRKANIKDIVEELKKDSRYTYVINTSPQFSEYSYIINVSPQYATISNDGNIKDTVDVTDETKVIYVIHKEYEFKIGEDNGKITIEGNKEELGRKTEKEKIFPREGLVDYWPLQGDYNNEVENRDALVVYKKRLLVQNRKLAQMVHI